MLVCSGCGKGLLGPFESSRTLALDLRKVDQFFAGSEEHPLRTGRKRFPTAPDPLGREGTLVGSPVPLSEALSERDNMCRRRPGVFMTPKCAHTLGARTPSWVGHSFVFVGSGWNALDGSSRQGQPNCQEAIAKTWTHSAREAARKRLVEARVRTKAKLGSGDQCLKGFGG